ncbi:hypothetical protein N5W20_00530 [Candidatus Kirkpatrickella diaphorinae]|uniref:ATP-grasp domain-containing protein n=1 Tax=Candidatus Kirkpatrickella diaphorinae TaxID=2984322 RepID=A0ABY6GJG2_9PROT|nr:hypothetical protein [Candidatus Kirkpatrickella diaphorinae]UYH51404.1 hypothetical protein N5W20_00530 [Candidatus Kirkpatrickella diaphorinae]
MNILILHRVPYQRIDYAKGIDHNLHHVTYFGVRSILDSLPDTLPCTRVARPGDASAFEEARNWIENNPQSFDRIISLSEYELLDAAKLRAWLGVPGASVDEVNLVRDKVLMKKAVSEAGLRVPRFLPLPSLLDGPESAPWTGTTVLKPHNGASSEDVRVFSSPDQARAAIKSRTSGIARLDNAPSAITEYEVEEFVTGNILHFDGLVANGQLLTITASRYVGTCLGYAQGQPLGSYHFPIMPFQREWAAKALSAVGIRQGSFHLEAIEQEGLVFLEVGNRVGGADVVETFERATGVHMPSQELSILLDGRPLRPLPLTQISPIWHGWFVFPGHAHAGQPYRGIAGIDHFRDDPSVIRWAELPLGTPQSERTTYSAHEAPLAGMTGHADWHATRDWIKRLFEQAGAAADQARASVAQQAHQQDFRYSRVSS